MLPGTIILLNGASSAGKTSLLRALQAQLAEPYLDAGIDKFIWMLPERYLERPLWDDVLGLATEAGQMGRRLFSAMHRAIATLSQAGMNVLADHVLVEPAWARECAELLADLPAYLVGVRCPFDVLVERERSRKNRTLGQAAAQFPVVHDFLRLRLRGGYQPLQRGGVCKANYPIHKVTSAKRFAAHARGVFSGIIPSG